MLSYFNLAVGQPFLGSICMVAFNFAPVGWALCNGQLLPISEYDALFLFIRDNIRGDGQNTFALPDLRGRVPNIMSGSGHRHTHRARLVERIYNTNRNLKCLLTIIPLQ